MDPEVEAIAAEIFADALDLPANERADFLHRRCGDDTLLRARIESLLEAHPKGEALLGSPGLQAEVQDAAGALVARHLGLRLGPYRLTGLIAAGGMGLVYRGERCDADFEQRVAVKLIHAGMGSADVLQRFRTERQLLARLQHPNIARLLDGGATPDGDPYLVMEFVDGVPLDRHCDERQLTLRERLQLFCTVCDAVHYAHRNLVVHRDLKPGNILVDTNGHAKLMDFGIAKVLEPEGISTDVTATERRVMTPRYASPEQLRGESITTASDVYSLGVLLYELLTGRSPYRTQRLWSAEFVREISEVEPLAPSAASAQAPEAVSAARGTTRRKLAQALLGDVDTIVLEALRKEPERRYASAEEFASDIRRYLSGMPVLARPDTLRYRVSKFARRNRALVIGVAVAFAALAVGLVVSVAQYGRAVQARQRELEGRAEAQHLAYEGSIAAAEGSIRTNRLLEARRQLDLAPPNLRGWEWQHLANRLDRSLLSIHAHKSAVTGVRFTPDGSRVVSASEDSTLRMWNARTGEEIVRLGPLQGVPRSLAVDTRGVHVAVGLEMGKAQVFDLADGHSVLSLTDPHPDVYPLSPFPFDDDPEIALLDHPSTWATVDFNPRADQVAVGFYSGTVRLWDLETRREVRTLRAGRASCRTLVRFRPGGQQLAVGFETMPVELRDVATGRLVRTFGGNKGQVDMCFDASGRRLAAASQDQSIEVWDVDTGDLVVRMSGHGGSIRALEFDPTGEVVVSTATDLQVSGMHLRTGQRRWSYPGHTTNVHCLARSPNGSQLVTGDRDGCIKVWNLETEDVRSLVIESALTFRRHWAEDVSPSPDGSRLMTSTIEQATQIWDLVGGVRVAKIVARDLGPAKPLCVGWASDGRRVAVGLTTGWIALQDPDTAKMLMAFRGHAGDVCALDADPKLAQFVTGSRDSTVRLWEFGSEQPIRILRGHQGAVLAVCYNSDGQAFASGSEDSTIRIWDVTGRVQHVLRGHEGAVRGLAFSPDGSLLASAAFDGTVRLWDATNGTARGKLLEKAGRMYAVAFTPDGSRLAAGGTDGIVRLFDPAAGREVARLHGHDDRIFWLEFIPGKSTLLSSSLDGTIRIWEVAKAVIGTTDWATSSTAQGER